MNKHDGILPLPERVVAQITSSIAIRSLTGVVLELLKNSLDAKATKVDATVDFARGTCTVEDDGLGIPPLEFREEGGLGKLYCTSKHEAQEALLGCNGTFLASLSAVSLLSITSRHHEHRSHNSIKFHYAHTIERQLPASYFHHEVDRNHGTCVAVRNLFGNLPVRVKQRAKVSEHRSERDRLWEALKANVAGLLLAWAGTVSVKVRDADNHVIFSLNTSDLKQLSSRRGPDVLKPRSAHLTSMLNVLTQAGYIAVDDWPSWVPASASTCAISIKGAISLEPAPTKSTQFISLGLRPLSAELEHNEFYYDHVNRLFGLSTFGAIEENAEMDDLETFPRNSGKCFKSNSYTNRQSKTRRSVDRHPMFHLCISLHGELSSHVSRHHSMGYEKNVQAIVDVLDAMITQWLAIHHFLPIQPRQDHNRKANLIASPTKSSETGDTLFSVGMSQLPHSDITRSPWNTPTSSTPGVFTKKQCLGASASAAPAQQLRHRAFAEWSRIKSAKASSLIDLSALPKLDRLATAHFMLQPAAQSVLNVQTSRRLDHEQVSELKAESNNDRHNDTILWTDPLAKKTHLLDARTGCMMPSARGRLGTNPVLALPSRPRSQVSKSLRLPPKTATTEKAPWLVDILKTWDNPIFQASEKRIEVVSLREDAPGKDLHHHGPHRCSQFNLNEAFSGVPAAGSTRLSKDSLLGAEVIAQVDKKFILVKAKYAPNTTLAESGSAMLMVLVDQHAADERVQAEDLFRELCTPTTPSSTRPRYRSKLGHHALVASTTLSKPIQFTISRQETKQFIKHAEKFADWGILFDVLAPISPPQTDASAKEPRLISVTALPPSIYERCKSDTGLLISFLRSTVWKYASDPNRTLHVSSMLDETSQEWAKRLATCPEGLIDLVNSRACRSAIMFNDELNVDQCRQLVQKLATCVFPFICAHGRPSMVPLVDIGMTWNIGQASQHDGNEGTGGFIQAWRQWKR